MLAFRRFTLSLILVLLFCGTQALAGTWVDETRVTNDLVLQDTSEVVIAPDETIYAVWPEDESKKISLFLMRSTDQGATWSLPSRVLGPDSMYGFRLRADAAGLHLVFIRQDGLDNEQLFYSRSTDNGQTFSTPVQVGAWNDVWLKELFCGDGRILIYAKDGIGGHFIYLSADGGQTWQEKALLPGIDIWNPDFVLRGGVIHVAFGGFISTPIAYSRSVDDGATWAAPVAVSVGAGAYSQCPSLAVDDQAIHVSWEDDRLGNFNIMYAQSGDNGLTWGANVRMNDTYYGARTRLLCDEEGLHMAWCQYHGAGWPINWGSNDYGIIRYKFSGDSGVTWSAEYRVSQNEAIPSLDYPDMGANYVRLGEYGQGIAAFWLDKRDGNIEIYMRNALLQSFTADNHLISAVKGGVVNFDLDAGSANAFRTYLVLGSMDGTTPGIPLPSGTTVLPLNWDQFTDSVINRLNTVLFSDFFGALDSAGRGVAQINAPVLSSGMVGKVLHFAYVLEGEPWDFASNPEWVEIGL